MFSVFEGARRYFTFFSPYPNGRARLGGTAKRIYVITAELVITLQDGKEWLEFPFEALTERREECLQKVHEAIRRLKSPL